MAKLSFKMKEQIRSAVIDVMVRASVKFETREEWWNPEFWCAQIEASVIEFLTVPIEAEIIEARNQALEDAAKKAMTVPSTFLDMQRSQREYSWHDVMDALSKAVAEIRSLKSGAL